MGNKVTVGTDICGDLAPLVPTSLDCSMCTLGFPQFGGRVGISFYTNNFCPATAIEPMPSIWLNGMYNSFAQLKCKQPGFNAEPNPGLFVGEGYFSGISYTNPKTGNTAAHQFRWRVELEPTDHHNVHVLLKVYVLGPGAVWDNYGTAGFGATEILGPNDDINIPYRNRRFVPQTGLAFLNWKGETVAYPPAANPTKGDVYTTQWSVAGGGNLPSPPFPANTPAGMAFVWNGTDWATAGYTTRWDYEGVRASDGVSYSTRRFIPFATTSSATSGVGDGVWYLSMTIGTEALREGCGGGGNAFPVCGMWAPIADDSQGHAWHTCFRAIVKQTNGNSWDLSAKQLGVDMPDCGKKFLVDDGTIQYGPFCGCDRVVRKPWGWESEKNDDIPCYYPEVVNIGVPGEATGQVQEIQTDGVGSIVVKQIDGGPLYACHAVATGTDANGCTTNDWEIVQVTQVMRTGSPYIYRVIFPNHGVTLYLHSLRFPSDPIMPSACINAAQTTLEDVVANDTPEPATLEALQSVGRKQSLQRLKLNCVHLGPRQKNSGYG